MTDALRRYLEYYRDLGIRNLYLTGYTTSTLPKARETAAAATAAGAVEAAVPVAAPPAAAAVPRPATTLDLGLAPAAPADAAPALPEPVETLDDILADIGNCTRCRLHKGRNKLVFGVGNPKAKLVFVGEGPGADEDEQGIPFVGRAGQLLTAMIDNTAAKEGIPIRRADVYICNVVKCRPPDNRTPEPDEMEICGQFLARQLAVLRPRAICALGGTAAKALTGRKEGVTRMRGNWFKWRGIPLMVTYHPSYLLRPYNQNAKREAWEDLKKVLHLVYD
ncbi:MAG: uracil-DNA glycosylase [bacterium]|jgi:uracil-DNA glycosylase family 4